MLKEFELRSGIEHGGDTSSNQIFVVNQEIWSGLSELPVKQVERLVDKYKHVYVGVPQGDLVSGEGYVVEGGVCYEIFSYTLDPKTKHVGTGPRSTQVPFSVFVDEQVESGFSVVVSTEPLINEEPSSPNLVKISDLPEIVLSPLRSKKIEERFVTRSAVFDKKPEIKLEKNGHPLVGRLVDSWGGLVDLGGTWDFQNTIRHDIATAVAVHPQERKFSVISPTGSGKSRIEEDLARIITSSGLKVVFVYPYTDLLTQNGDRLDVSSGQYYSRRKDRDKSEVWLTTYQSLFRLIAETGWKDDEFVIVFDEAHFLLNQWVKKITNEISENTYCFAFTATDGITTNLQHLGFVNAYRSEVSEGIARGYLAPVKIRRYFSRVNEAVEKRLDWISEKGYEVDRDIVESLTKDEVYNSSVVQVFLNECCVPDSSGQVVEILPTIIEAETIAHAKDVLYPAILKKLPSHLHPKVKVVVSDNETTNKQRKDLLHAVRTGGVDLVIHVRMVGVGIDLPRMQNIILRPRPYSEFLTEQSIGRVMRSKEGKTAKIIEIFPSSDATPEELGFRTALQVFGLKSYHPDIVYYGNSNTYSTEVARKDRVSQKAIVADYHEIPDACYLGGSYMVVKEENGYEPKRNRIAEKLSAEELENYLVCCLYLYQSLEGGSGFSVSSYSDPETGEVKLRTGVQQLTFRAIFNLQNASFANRFFNGSIAEMDRYLLGLAKKYKLKTPIDIDLGPTGVIEKVAMINGDTNPDYLKKTVLKECGLSANAAEVLRRKWVESGMIHHGFKSFDMVTELIELSRVIQDLDIPLLFPGFSFNADPLEQVQKIELTVINYMKFWYSQTEYASRWAKVLPLNYFFPSWNTAVVDIWKLHKRIKMSVPAIVFGRYGSRKTDGRTYSNANEYMLYLTREFDSTMTEDSNSEKLTKLRGDVINRLRSGQVSIFDTPTVVLGMSYSSAVSRLGRENLTIQDFLDDIYAEIDDDFRWSNKLYKTSSLANFLAALKEWSDTNGSGLDWTRLSANNVGNYLPPRCTSIGQRVERKTMGRMFIRGTLSKRLGVSPNELIQAIRNAMGSN